MVSPRDGLRKGGFFEGTTERGSYQTSSIVHDKWSIFPDWTMRWEFVHSKFFYDEIGIAHNLYGYTYSDYLPLWYLQSPLNNYMTVTLITLS